LENEETCAIHHILLSSFLALALALVNYIIIYAIN